MIEAYFAEEGVKTKDLEEISKSSIGLEAPRRDESLQTVLQMID
jgi:hypothetical protein